MNTNNYNNNIKQSNQHNEEQNDVKYNDNQFNKQQQNNNNNSNYDYDYNYNENDHYKNNNQNQGYYYDNYEEYEDEYHDDIDLYDECDWDPQRNKMRVTTYKSDKKPKQKKNPLVESHQKTMKVVNRINNYNNYNRNKHKMDRNLYGIIIINGKELYLGSICGKQITQLYSKSSGFQAGKHNKGGQSAQRFGRIYDNKINTFIKECALKINKIFDKNSIIKTNGIILGGNGTMKDKLYQSKFLKEEIKSLIIKTINTKYGGKNGFIEINGKLKNNQLFEEHNKADINTIKEIMDMAIDTDKVDMISIGVNETIKAIKLNIVKYVILVNDAFKFVIKKKTKPIKFIKNDNELHETIKDMNIEIGKTWKIVGFMDYIKNICRINNVKLKIVSNGSEIAKQFTNEFSGCCAVLYQSFDYLKE